MFDVAADFVAVDAVAITDDEQVEALLPAHVGRQRIRILVNLVRVAWLMPTGRGKSKLCDGVETLVSLASCHLLLVMAARRVVIIGATGCRCLSGGLVLGTALGCLIMLCHTLTLILWLDFFDAEPIY